MAPDRNPKNSTNRHSQPHPPSQKSSSKASSHSSTSSHPSASSRTKDASRSNILDVYQGILKGNNPSTKPSSLVIASMMASSEAKAGFRKASTGSTSSADRKPSKKSTKKEDLVSLYMSRRYYFLIPFFELDSGG